MKPYRKGEPFSYVITEFPLTDPKFPQLSPLAAAAELSREASMWCDGWCARHDIFKGTQSDVPNRVHKKNAKVCTSYAPSKTPPQSRRGRGAT